MNATHTRNRSANRSGTELPTVTKVELSTDFAANLLSAANDLLTFYHTRQWPENLPSHLLKLLTCPNQDLVDLTSLVLSALRTARPDQYQVLSTGMLPSQQSRLLAPGNVLRRIDQSLSSRVLSESESESLLRYAVAARLTLGLYSTFCDDNSSDLINGIGHVASESLAAAAALANEPNSIIPVRKFLYGGPQRIRPEWIAGREASQTAAEILQRLTALAPANLPWWKTRKVLFTGGLVGALLLGFAFALLFSWLIRTPVAAVESAALPAPTMAIAVANPAPVVIPPLPEAHAKQFLILRDPAIYTADGLSLVGDIQRAWVDEKQTPAFVDYRTLLIATQLPESVLTRPEAKPVIVEMIRRGLLPEFQNILIVRRIDSTKSNTFEAEVLAATYQAGPKESAPTQISINTAWSKLFEVADAVTTEEPLLEARLFLATGEVSEVLAECFWRTADNEQSYLAAASYYFLQPDDKDAWEQGRQIARAGYLQFPTDRLAKMLSVTEPLMVRQAITKQHPKIWVGPDLSSVIDVGQDETSAGARAELARKLASNVRMEALRERERH